MLKTIIRKNRLGQIYLSARHFRYYRNRYEKLLPDEHSSRKYICFLNKSGKVEQFADLLDHIHINLRKNVRFQNWIDTGIYVCAGAAVLGNTSPDYEKVISMSLHGMKECCKGGNIVQKQNYHLLCVIEKYLDRILDEFEKIQEECTDEEATLLFESREYFANMKDKSAQSLEEVLQRIIFWSDLFWQSGHRLIGLGRLDKLLDFIPVLDDERELDIIGDFYHTMHRYYAFKSNGVAMGDTGQIIVLGGIEPDGRYFSNRWTYLLIQAMMKYRLPDPKLLLRVSNNMPEDLLKMAICCIATGVGSPLLSNDQVVVPALEDFGYTHDDACNYVTSACWEPLAYGKSLEINNINDINYAEALVETYIDSSFDECTVFEDILDLYFRKLNEKLLKVLQMLNDITWECDPLLTLLTRGCRESGKDISDGGAVYSNYGVLTVGLANVVNSLLFIKYNVFEKKEYTLAQIKMFAQNNYEGYESERNSIAQDSRYFGKDNQEILELTERITEYVYDILSGFRNRYGGRVKWGYSSSSYMESGRRTAATLDGRKNGEALAVHISTSGSTAYTELVGFASRLNYQGQRANGNVVDFFVSPEFIKSNFEKFTKFIMLSIRAGFFQMQMNVVDSRTLIEAKVDPDSFPDLIVRVWGFSAYFKDLPEEYQDVLIRRALQSEGKEYA